LTNIRNKEVVNKKQDNRYPMLNIVGYI